MSKNKLILRWVAVLPAFIVGSLVGTLFVFIQTFLGGMFMGILRDASVVKFTDYTLSPMFSGIFSLYFGVEMAPKYKKAVALVLGVLTLAVAIINFVGSLYSKKDSIIWLSLGAIFLIGGAGYVVYKYCREGDNFEIFG